MRKKFWAVARSTFEVGLKDKLKKLERLDKDCIPDLLYYNIETWCRTYFKTYSKCDVVDNNMSETFNGWILAARHKTIITMLEEIRVQVMKRIQQLRDFANSWEEDISPMAMKVLRDNTNIAMTCCNIEWNGDSGFQVVEGEYGHVVDLRKETCSCRAWELKGIPCAHAICAMHHRKIDPLQHVAHWYHKQTHIQAFSNFIQPVTNMKMWLETGNPPIEPPEVKKMPGRPKKNRRREHDEPRHGKASRRGLQITCSICKTPGHNKSKCTKKPTQDSQSEIRTYESGSTSATPANSQTTPSSRGRGRGRGSGRPRGRPRGRGAYTPITRENIGDASSDPSQKRPRVSGYGIFINERNGWTCSNIGTPSQRVISTGSSAVKNSAQVIGDLGYKPRGLKWKGKAAMSTNTLMEKRACKARKTQAKAAQANQQNASASQQSNAQGTQPSGNPAGSRPPIPTTKSAAQTNNKKGSSTVVQWKY
ncbi:hypothetical protein M5689_012421 [Euphorbia peplus]|nr:hypothetical protein M5689_012421 [Euphorbia peplus]